MENKIKLVVDSSIDLPQELLDKENVDVVRYTITIGDKSYLDGKDIDVPGLFKLIDQYGVLPKTAAMGPGIFEEIYEKYKNDYSDLIYIGIGSFFSTSFRSAQLAAEDYPYVHVIDSQNLSTGTGLLVLKIIKMIKEGKTAEEIVNEINAMIPLVRCSFAIDSLKYLHMGGRCKATTKYIASALHIKPIIAVIDGKMEITKKPIGFRKALDLLIEQAIAYKDIMDLDHIMITHQMAKEDAEYIREKLEKVYDKDILMDTTAGGTIATHCGSRTIGILYILKENK